MDTVFGSEGVAAADFERQAEINREIGLDRALQNFDARVADSSEKPNHEESEKPAVLSEKPAILSEKREV